MSNSWKNKFGVVKNGVLKEFTVYRGSWARGPNRSGAVNRLLGPTGDRCCVGFMAETAYIHNDNPTLGSSEREGLIAQWFKDTFDVKVHFVDGPEPK